MVNGAKLISDSMKRQQPTSGRDAEPTREEFADGSALVTFPDGGMVIFESELAKACGLREGGPVNHDQPQPRRVAIERKQQASNQGPGVCQDRNQRADQRRV